MDNRPLKDKLPVIQGEWGIMCENCKYVRKFGKAQFLANAKAREHAHRYADHVVCVTQTIIVERWTGYTPKLTEQDLLDEPPF